MLSESVGKMKFLLGSVEANRDCKAKGLSNLEFNFKVLLVCASIFF
jgi:hypothetical protein